MNIPHITECFSSFSVTFIEDRFCLFRTWSFTLSKNVLDPNDKSNSVSSSPMMNCCGLAPLWGQTTGCPVLSWVSSSSKNNVLDLLMRETWLELVCPCPRSFIGSPRSIIHRFFSFPLWRRPSTVIIPLWVACWREAFHELLMIIVRRGFWVAAHNGLPRSILSLSFRVWGILMSIASLPRVYWSRRWYVRRRSCNVAHHWSRYRCDSFFSWILLWSFRHRFRTNCRTEVANIEQTQKMIPFVTCEISLG